MSIYSDPLKKYLEDHSSQLDEVYKEIERDTFLTELSPTMIAGEYMGRFLIMISQMLQPNRILEIGAFTGYSAICLAQGLIEDGKLFTIEIDEEKHGKIKENISLAGLTEKVILKGGDAKDIISELDESFDLVFIDANKLNYTKYYELIMPKLKVGGIILIDNALWFGRVIESKPTKDTTAINAFNMLVQKDNRVENILLPLRDGVMMVRKIKK